MTKAVSSASPVPTATRRGSQDRPEVHHFLGLAGAAHLDTPYWRLGREGILEAVDARAIASVTGSPGTGKTHLLNTVAPEIELRIVSTEFDHRPTMLSVSRQLLDDLVGAVPAGHKHALIPHLRAALEGPLVLIIDEAQRLNRECIDHLRFLHDHRSTDFAMVLAGGQGCWEVLGKEPQLRRRIYRPCFFRPLTIAEIRTYIPDLHPAWAQQPTAVLDRIDAEFGAGLLGNWAAITKTLIDLAARGLSGDALVETALFKHGVVDG